MHMLANPAPAVSQASERRFALGAQQTACARLAGVGDGVQDVIRLTPVFLGIHRIERASLCQRVQDVAPLTLRCGCQSMGDKVASWPL